MTPIQYCENRTAHLNCTLVVSGSDKTYHYNGVKYSENEFYSTFPVVAMEIRPAPENKHLKGENPDGTKAWMK